MRILFVVNRLAHVRHFDRAVRLLADRGHDVCLASQDDDVELWGVLARQPRIRAVVAPRNRGDDWGAAATMVRRTRDYIRYLHPRYAAANLLRERAFEKMIGAVSDSAETMGPEWSAFLLRVPKTDQKRLDVLLAKLETAIPADPDIDEFLTAQHPDALVLSPMVGIGFTQADLVKSARALGIPSAMAAVMFSLLTVKTVAVAGEFADRVAWLAGEGRSLSRMEGAWREVHDRLFAEPALSYWNGKPKSVELQLAQFASECLPSSERLLVLWFAPEIYYYADRLIASRHLFYDSGYQDIEQELRLSFEKVMRYAPPLVYATGELDTYTRTLYPRVVDYVHRNYELIGAIEDNGRRYQVFLRKDASVVRQFGEHEWPCLT